MSYHVLPKRQEAPVNQCCHQRFGHMYMMVLVSSYHLNCVGACLRQIAFLAKFRLKERMASYFCF
jgi:hypothetical protein